MSKHIHVIGLGISVVSIALDKHGNIVLCIKNNNTQLDVTKKLKEQEHDRANESSESTYLLFPDLEQGIACVKAFFMHLESIDTLVEDFRKAHAQLSKPE